MMGKSTCGSPEDTKTVDTEMGLLPYDTRFVSFLVWKETTTLKNSEKYLV